MAESTIKIAKRIDTSYAGGYVTSASMIAYSTETANEGTALEYQKMTVSVKDKIDALITELSGKLTSSDLTSINSDITDIKSKLNAINLDASSVSYTPTGEAETTVDVVLQALQNAVTALQEAKAAETVTTSLVIYSDGVTLKQFLDELNIGTPATDATYYADFTEYNADKGTNLSASQFNALTTSQKIKTAATEATGIYKLTADAQTAADTATSQAVLAENAANTTATNLTAITTKKNEAIQAIEEIATLQNNTLTENLNTITATKTLAELLMAAFNASTTDEDLVAFKIVTNEAYASLVNDDSVDENALYFCYDAEADTYTYCTITAKVATSTEGGYVSGGGVFKVSATDTTILLASAKDGYEFVGWMQNDSDEIISTSALYNAPLTETATYYALFRAKDTYYTVIAVPNDSTLGNVTIATANSDNRYISGNTLTITATATKSHYSFSKWTYITVNANGTSTNSSDTTNPKSISVSKDVVYTAVFAEDPKYTVTATAGTGGTVTNVSESTYYAGDTVTLTATAADGYLFVNWTNDVDSTEITDATTQITVSTDINYTANFEEITE